MPSLQPKMEKKAGSTVLVRMMRIIEEDQEVLLDM
jgi:hypothetical protein